METTKEQTKFTISAVHRLTGKARSTINNHIENGKLSFIMDDGKKLIEASELCRAYGDLLEIDSDGKLRSKTKRIDKQTNSNDTDTQHWQTTLDRERQERDRERIQLTETIEHLRNDLEKSQGRESRVTLLLEHQSKDSGQWERQMSEIEKRMPKVLLPNCVALRFSRMIAESHRFPNVG